LKCRELLTRFPGRKASESREIKNRKTFPCGIKIAGLAFLRIRVTARFLSGIPHPHLLGVCRPNLLFLSFDLFIRQFPFSILCATCAQAFAGMCNSCAANQLIASAKGPIYLKSAGSHFGMTFALRLQTAESATVPLRLKHKKINNHQI
jgi:hypothetical protein